MNSLSFQTPDVYQYKRRYDINFRDPDWSWDLNLYIADDWYYLMTVLLKYEVLEKLGVFSKYFLFLEAFFNFMT